MPIVLHQILSTPPNAASSQSQVRQQGWSWSGIHPGLAEMFGKGDPRRAVLRFADMGKIEIGTRISAPSATPRPVFLVLSAASTSSTGEPLCLGRGGQTAVLPKKSGGGGQWGQPPSRPRLGARPSRSLRVVANLPSTFPTHNRASVPTSFPELNMDVSCFSLPTT